MSARPRPVTATFPPPPLISPVHLRPTSRSPSPINSTASLLSILDHNSYESSQNRIVRNEDDSSESYSIQRHGVNASTRSNPVEEVHSSRSAGQDKNGWVGKNIAKENADNRRTVGMAKTKHPDLKRSKSVEPPKQNIASTPSADSPRNISYATEPSEVGSSFEKDMKDSSNKLSAWERWIVRKAKEDRTKAEQELERQRKLREEEEKKKKEKEKKKKDVEKVVGEWVKKYDVKKKQDVKSELQKSHELEEVKKKQKETVSEKAKVKYEEWVQKKGEEEARRKQQLAEKREKELLEKENKRKKNEEAFNAWCKKAQTRPRTAPSSYGYTDGKLTGYYDAGAYPVPSYVNPVPWRPVVVPKTKSQPSRKKQTSAKRRYYSSNYL